MVHSPDITDTIPLNVGNPGTSGLWTNNAEDYDVAIGGLPFFLAPNDQNPYQRETAPYRKDQFDNGKEPGEQSLTGWWIRSQSSFHLGTGIKFYDPSSGETTPYRFTDSQGVNVWTKGQVTLLKSMTENHVTTGSLMANGQPNQHMQSIKWGTTDGVLLHDEYDIDKIASDGTVTHFVDYNAGTDTQVFAIANDGTTAYWITNEINGGANKLAVYKKALTLDSTTPGTLMFRETGLIVTNATMAFIKERLVMCINNKVYEVTTAATTLPAAVYTHPTSTYIYTSVAESGPAIYCAGFNGSHSSIIKFTLNTSGSMPTLTSGITSAEMPEGERIYKIYHYLSYIAIGTDKGVRIAIISDVDGAINYGPLTVETTQPCYDFAARDKYLWCATGVNSEPGLIRIDLSAELETLRFGYANDVHYPGVTGHVTTACAFFDGTNQIAFCTNNITASNGHVYRENATELVSTGYVTTGAIRYGTLEPKHFKFIRGRGTFTYGSLDISLYSENNSLYNVITYNSSVGSPEAATTEPEAAQEYVSYKFTLLRDATDTSQGPVLKGYQVKALPATARQRIIQFPVWCYDVETDRYSVKTGYEGRAWERIEILESLEKLGDIINVQDFTTGERVQGLIERINFTRKTPPSGSFDGFGGLLLITIRTVL